MNSFVLRASSAAFSVSMSSSSLASVVAAMVAAKAMRMTCVTLSRSAASTM